jgi:aerobic carbon-monoxide dehydrogenase medium subunit
MKPAPFEYHAPRNLEEAIGLLASLESAKVLAGGQSLVAMMNFRYVIVDHLVDLGGVAALSDISTGNGMLRIGAMTRQRDLEFSAEVKQHCPIMHEALLHVGHRQTRNRGTIGGSLAHADPAAELPALCLLHDAEIEIASRRGTRRVPMRSFGLGFMTTTLEPDEIATAVELRLWPAGHGYGFQEFARRRGDFALAGAAALLDVGPDQTVRRAVIALFGVAASPVRLDAAEAGLTGKRLDMTAITVAAAEGRAVEPLEDIHAGADYRRHLAQVLTRRALVDAARCVGVTIEAKQL